MKSKVDSLTRKLFRKWRILWKNLLSKFCTHPFLWFTRPPPQQKQENVYHSFIHLKLRTHRSKGQIQKESVVHTLQGKISDSLLYKSHTGSLISEFGSNTQFKMHRQLTTNWWLCIKCYLYCRHVLQGSKGRSTYPEGMAQFCLWYFQDVRDTDNWYSAEGVWFRFATRHCR